jgi:carbon-monoxide dehydrogenase medium subunit
MIEDYIRPKTIDEALSLLERTHEGTRILAGGTDLLLKHGDGDPSRWTLIDIVNIPELVGISSTEEGVRIGAACPLAEIVKSPLLTGSMRVLGAGASTVGSPQIRNLATIGGNLCNASPSADTIPALLVLDAQVVIASAGSRRSLPLVEFFTGPGRTKLQVGEMLVSILIPAQPAGACSVYLKHAPRSAMDLAIVGVAVQLWISDTRLQGHIALGAVAPTPLRAFKSEALLAASPSINLETFRSVSRCAIGEISPISDLRASASYRKDMVELLTFRALCQANAQLQQHGKEEQHG